MRSISGTIRDNHVRMIVNAQGCARDPSNCARSRPDPLVIQHIPKGSCGAIQTADEARSNRIDTPNSRRTTFDGHQPTMPVWHSGLKAISPAAVSWPPGIYALYPVRNFCKRQPRIFPKEYFRCSGFQVLGLVMLTPWFGRTEPSVRYPRFRREVLEDVEFSGGKRTSGTGVRWRYGRPQVFHPP